MHTRILKQFKDAVRLRKYVVTAHAVEEMDDDDFTIYDVEHCILHGEIIDRQKDEKSVEWKYLLCGMTFQERGIRVVAKMSITGKMVIITVYAV